VDFPNLEKIISMKYALCSIVLMDPLDSEPYPLSRANCRMLLSDDSEALKEKSSSSLLAWQCVRPVKFLESRYRLWESSHNLYYVEYYIMGSGLLTPIGNQYVTGLLPFSTSHNDIHLPCLTSQSRRFRSFSHSIRIDIGIQVLVRFL